MTREDAIEIMRKNMPSDKSLPVYEAIQTLIPELAESEDERIRKEIIEYLKLVDKGEGDYAHPMVSGWIAYLEKQKEQEPKVKYVYPKFRVGDEIVEVTPNGYCPPVVVKYIGEGSYSCESKDGKRFLSFPIKRENEYRLVKQKPAEWSDTKELVFKDICKHLEVEGYSGWVLLLNALRNGEFQPKQEWSKEDQKNYDDIMSALEESLNANRCYFTSDDVDFLKSLPFKLKKENEGWRHYIWATNLRFDFTALIKYDNTDNYEIVQAGNRPKQEKNGVYILIKDIKPQSHWKPSEEQMEALDEYIYAKDPNTEKYSKAVLSLRDDLKKL